MSAIVQPTMLLITSAIQGQKTFKLMPIHKECPFNEGIFMPTGRMLAMISAEKKESVHMLPRLDDNGDAILIKQGNRPNQKDYKEQRVHLETYTEHYLMEKEEIISLVKMLAVNADSYDFQKYMVDPSIIMPEEKKIELIVP
jgi:hypothetical protein